MREEELSLLYNRATATISIPPFDQLSTTVLESLSCGTPVICSDIEPYRERVINEVNGLLVNPFDTDELSRALYRSLTENYFKERMKEKSRESVKHDSWEENARYMISVYDKPLEKFLSDDFIDNITE